MFYFTIQKILNNGDGTFVGTGTVPPLFQLTLVLNDVNSVSVLVQMFTTLAAAKTGAAALVNSSYTLTWTDAGTTASLSNTNVMPVSA